MRVIVAGAGLGGLTLAQGLRRSGIDVAVYERDGAHGRPQGVSLHLDERGTAALRACLPPGHRAMAEATLGGPRNRTLLLSEVDGELAIVGSRPADGTRVRPGRQASRRLLRAVLLTGLEDTVRFGAALTRFELCSDGTVRAWFSDGTTDIADVLVGADGVGSTVRRQYLPHARVVDSGRPMLMGATPLRAVAATGLPELIGHSPAAAQVGDTTVAMGIHRFAEPPTAARRRWLPAMPAGVVDSAENYVMWAMAVTQEQLGTVEAPANVWSLATELAADLHPTLRTVVEQAWPDVTVAIRVGVIPPVPKWPVGPVTVIGDAIHLAPGFGGNLAMQDAHRLRDALVRAERGEQSLLAAIGAAEDAMRRDSNPHADLGGRVMPREPRDGAAAEPVGIGTAEAGA
ncbi:NAD(P)/FAD-dependent oxidoreductase [Pseudonocardia sp. DSM 110487]|uniref:FAD-dependent oxidoreductase n=1 Tax=Pseudonocardia sp. DSM 110487 TaxID=2865833 RepID=UPI002107CFC3|nr:FAD-dependent monooxygenase [Pseudonocardia sp. DSM 110487]